MGQDLEVGADLGDQITDHQAVQDPERMIRDHHRPLGRDRLRARGIVVDLEPEMADRRFQKLSPGRGRRRVSMQSASGAVARSSARWSGW